MDVEGFVNENVRRFLEMADAAEVLAVGFRIFNQRLLIDMRSSEVDPPLIRVVPRVNSMEERLRELRKIRPRFQTPQQFYFVMWPRSIAAFRDLGPWQRILERLEGSGHPGVSDEAANALNMLFSLEREETLQAVRGINYRSLWERSK